MPLLLNGHTHDEPKVELDIRFVAGSNRNTRPRTSRLRGIVLHWTGAENPPDRVRRTLEERDLSVDFCVDSGIGEGRRRIVQLADPVVTRTAHAGIANPGFLGIEAVSRGFARREDVVGSDLRDRTDLDWEVPHDLYTDRLNHRAVNFAAFSPGAVHDTVWLVETLCGRLGLPRRIPWRSLGAADDPATARALRRIADDPWCRMLEEIDPVVADGKTWVPDFSRDPRPWGRVRDFEGVLGHFHVHEEKCDPGPQFFYALWREGFNPVGKRFPRR